MPFPTDDRPWNDTLVYLLERRRPGERTLAPDEFADELPFVRGYGQREEADETIYAWVVVHKGLTELLGAGYLHRLPDWSVPVYANEVFVVFAREPGFAMSDVSDSDHVKALFASLPPDESPRPPAQAPAERLAEAEAPAAGPVAVAPDRADEAPATPAPALPAPLLDRQAPPGAMAAPGRLRQQETLRLMAEYLGDTAGRRVLDIGCGLGRFAALLPHAEVLGIDPAPDLIEDARQRHAGLPHFRFLAADAAGLALEEPPFDIVLLVDALPPAVPAAAAMLESTLRHVRAGGLLLLAAENSQALHHRMAGGAGTASGFTLAELTGMARAAGFRPLRCDGVVLPWPDPPAEDEAARQALCVLGRLAGPDYAQGIVLLATRD